MASIKKKKTKTAVLSIEYLSAMAVEGEFQELSGQSRHGALVQ